MDVVISGINNGHNAGMAVHYSGTVAGAREGMLNNIPSIAASISYKRPGQNAYTIWRTSPCKRRKTYVNA